MQIPSMYQQDTRESYKADWDAADPQKRASAREGIQRRIATGRGGTLTGTLVLAGLVGAAEVALVVAFFKEPQLRLVTQWLIVALVTLCIGIMPPPLTALFPRHRHAEGKEALAREEWEWGFEDARRSSHQRSQLWRMGACLSLSLTFKIIALGILFFTL